MGFVDSVSLAKFEEGELDKKHKSLVLSCIVVNFLFSNVIEGSSNAVVCSCGLVSDLSKRASRESPIR